MRIPKFYSIFKVLLFVSSAFAQETGEQVVLFDRTSGEKAIPLVQQSAEAPKQEMVLFVKETPKVEKKKNEVAKVAKVKAPAAPKQTADATAAAAKADAANAKSAKTEVPKVNKVAPAATVTPAPSLVSTKIKEDIQTDLVVTGRSQLNKSGQAVVVVPVAKPGHISGVTSTGEIVMIPAEQSKTDVTSSSLVASTVDAPVESSMASTENLMVAETVSTTKAEKKSFLQNMDLYAVATMGYMSYATLANVDTAFAFSGALGYRFASNKKMMMELGLGSAQYKMNVRNLTFFSQEDVFDVTQYQTSIAGKYQFDPILNTKFVPSVGGLLLYTYRFYDLTNGANSGDSGESSSVDAGITGNVEYAFNEKYSLGFDAKYILNMSNSINARYTNTNLGYRNVSIIETSSRYEAGISAKMNF